MEKVYRRNGYAITEDENGIWISWNEGPYEKTVTYPISRENLKKALKSDHDAYEVMIYAETGRWPPGEEERQEHSRAFLRKFPDLLVKIPENQTMFEEEELKVLLARAAEEMEEDAMIYYYYNDKGENVPKSEATIERVYAPAPNGLLRHVADRRLQREGGEGTVQYEMCFAGEYLEEIVRDLCAVMPLMMPEGSIRRARRERDLNSLRNLLLLGGEEEFICVDCNDRDWIFPLVVRCRTGYADEVRAVMQRWDKSVRLVYGQSASEDMRDVYGGEHTILGCLEEYYHMKIGDMFKIKSYEDKPLLISKFDTEDIKRNIFRFEEKYNISLPGQYKAFLQKYNGGYAPRTDILFRGEVVSTLKEFSGVGDVPRPFWDFHVKRLAERELLPIAGDIFGNDIAIGLGDGNRGRIFFCDHEEGDKPECEWRDLKAFFADCHSERIDKNAIQSIEERETYLVRTGRGNYVTEGLRRTWQEEIDWFKSVRQQEVILDWPD